MFISCIVENNLPGGVAQPLTKLFPAITIKAKLHILPINDMNPPANIRFINLNPLILLFGFINFYVFNNKIDVCYLQCIFINSFPMGTQFRKGRNFKR